MDGSSMINTGLQLLFWQIKVTIFGLETAEEINIQENMSNITQIKINNIGSSPSSIWLIMIYLQFLSIFTTRHNKKFTILDIAKEQFKCSLL
jgi:hypothetical protein